MIQRRAGRRGLRRSNHHPMIRAQRVPRRARGEPRARSVRVIHGPCAGSLVLTSQQVVTSPRGRLMAGRRAVAAVAMTLAMALVRGSTRIMFRRDRRDVSTTDGMATGMATGMGTRRPRRQRLVGAPWAASYLMRERRSEAIRGNQRQSETLIRGTQRRSSEAIVPSCTCRRIPRYSDRDHALPIGVPAPARRCPAAPSAAALTSARACRTV